MRIRVLLAAEVAFVLLLLVGVWLTWPPAALMLGGLLGVLACERATTRRPAEPPVTGSGGGER